MVSQRANSDATDLGDCLEPGAGGGDNRILPASSFRLPKERVSQERKGLTREVSTNIVPAAS